MPKIRKRYKIAAILLGLGISAFVFRSPILRTAAHAWTVNGTPVKANAIIVLGGGIDTRPFAAARLWKEGWAPVILVPTVAAGPAEKLGLLESYSDVICKVLLKEGVPESAIVRLGTDVTSTREEAKATLDWFNTQSASGTSTILLPTENLHTRRTLWIFEKTLGNRATSAIIPLPHLEFDIDAWWKKEQGLITFQNELIKYLYYWWSY